MQGRFDLNVPSKYKEIASYDGIPVMDVNSSGYASASSDRMKRRMSSSRKTLSRVTCVHVCATRSPYEIKLIYAHHCNDIPYSCKSYRSRLIPHHLTWLSGNQYCLRPHCYDRTYTIRAEPLSKSCGTNFPTQIYGLHLLLTAASSYKRLQ